MKKNPLLTIPDFLIVGESAPKNSGIKGKVSAEGIVGNITTYYGRYAKDSKEAFQKKQEKSYIDYTSRFCDKNKAPENVTYSDIGYLPLGSSKRNRYLKKMKSDLKEYGSILYRIVFSFKDYDSAFDYGLYTQKDWAEVMDMSIKQYFREAKFTQKYMHWIIDYHPIKKDGQLQPHVHLAYWQEPHKRMKIKGKIKSQYINYFNSIFTQNCKNRIKMNSALIKTKDRVDFYTKEAVNKYYDFHKDKAFMYELYNLLPYDCVFYNKNEFGKFLDKDDIDTCAERIMRKASIREQLAIFKDNINESLEFTVDRNFKDSILHELKESIINYLLNEGRDDFRRTNSTDVTKSKEHDAKSKNKYGEVSFKEAKRISSEHLKDLSLLVNKINDIIRTYNARLTYVNNINGKTYKTYSGIKPYTKIYNGIEYNIYDTPNGRIADPIINKEENNFVNHEYVSFDIPADDDNLINNDLNETYDENNNIDGFDSYLYEFEESLEDLDANEHTNDYLFVKFLNKYEGCRNAWNDLVYDIRDKDQKSKDPDFFIINLYKVKKYYQKEVINLLNNNKCKYFKTHKRDSLKKLRWDIRILNSSLNEAAYLAEKMLEEQEYWKNILGYEY